MVGPAISTQTHTHTVTLLVHALEQALILSEPTMFLDALWIPHRRNNADMEALLGSEEARGARYAAIVGLFAPHPRAKNTCVGCALLCVSSVFLAAAYFPCLPNLSCRGAFHPTTLHTEERM